MDESHWTVPRGAHFARRVVRIIEHLLAWLWTSRGNPQPCPQAHQGFRAPFHSQGPFSTGCYRRFQQACTSSIPQGGTGRVNAVQITDTPLANDLAHEVAVRLRSVGKLADRLEGGADLAYVVDVAKAIVGSFDNIDQGESS